MFKYAKEVNECLRGLQQGDTTKFDELYILTANHMMHVAERSLKNKIYVEDVVAETFIKIHKYIDSYDCSKDGFNWMFSIVKNTAYTYNENDSKATQVELQFMRDKQPLNCDGEFNEIDFFMAIECLDETDRQIAEMRFYEGYTMQAIGKQLQISKVAVFQRIKKICKIIEEKYKNR